MNLPDSDVTFYKEEPKKVYVIYSEIDYTPIVAFDTLAAAEQFIETHTDVDQDITFYYDELFLNLIPKFPFENFYTFRITAAGKPIHVQVDYSQDTVRLPPYYKFRHFYDQEERKYRRYLEVYLLAKNLDAAEQLAFAIYRHVLSRSSVNEVWSEK